MSRNDGRNLEAAAAAIERLLIDHDPQLSKKEISIELRRREIIDDVLHEFDIWISVEGVGIFLVECKDWQDKSPVGKNEIIVFSEKMSVTKALGGYIVARRFTKYAEARAKLHPGLRLQVMNQDLAGLASVSGFHAVYTSLIWDECHAYLYAPDSDPGITGDRECTYQGERTTLTDLISRLYKRALRDRMSAEPTNKRPEGPYRIDYEVEYEPDSLTIGDFKPSRIGIEIAFDVEIEHPTLSWHYNFVERGVSRRYRHTTELSQSTLTRVETIEGSSGTHIILTPQTGSSFTFVDDSTSQVELRVQGHRQL